MKRFHIVGQFHQALAKHAKQVADVQANKLSTALPSRRSDGKTRRHKKDQTQSRSIHRCHQ